jgi:hypothetical protein
VHFKPAPGIEAETVAGAASPSQAVAASPARPHKGSVALASDSLHLARSTNIDSRLSVGANRSALQASSTSSVAARHITKLASSRPLAEQ